MTDVLALDSTSADPWLEQQIASRDLTVLVFFRGAWCPWCQGYLKDLDRDVLDAIRARGGELIAVTAQDLEGARTAKRDWLLRYPVVSDPSLGLATRYGVAVTPRDQTPLAGDPNAYPHGMSQPALVAVSRGAGVVYSWAIDPATMNLGGASDRPIPRDAWTAIEAALDGRPGPETVATTDLEYMRERHPKLHAGIEAWLASQA